MTRRVMTADSLDEWADQVADDALDVLADADRTGRPDELVGKLADLHAAAVDVRNAARARSNGALD